MGDQPVSGVAGYSEVPSRPRCGAVAIRTGKPPAERCECGNLEPGRMTAQDQVVLPGDVRIVPLSELPSHVRSRLGGDDGDFAITRPHSRTPSKVICANAPALLKLFEKPKTLVEAIPEYCRAANLRPLEVLDEAYPLIESCLEAHLLVPPG